MDSSIDLLIFIEFNVSGSNFDNDKEFYVFWSAHFVHQTYDHFL